MSNKKTMTLNLPEREMLALEELAKASDMTKTGVMRQALRVYQALCFRRDRGEIEWDELFGLSKYKIQRTGNQRTSNQHAGDCNTRMADVRAQLKGCDCHLKDPQP